MNRQELLQKFASGFSLYLSEEKDPEIYRYNLNSRHKYLEILSHFPENLQGLKILEIGMSRFPLLLHQCWPGIGLTVLDLNRVEEELGPLGIGSIVHNLERDEPGLPAGEFDLAIFSEVLEHLRASPRFVMGKIHRMLRPGGRMILTTPNFLAVGNRLKMLLGRTPLEKIRTTDENPGHFREYAMDELLEYTRDAGFTVEKAFYPGYWNIPGIHMELYRLDGVSPAKRYLFCLPFVLAKWLLYKAAPSTGAALLIVARKENGP